MYKLFVLFVFCSSLAYAKQRTTHYSGLLGTDSIKMLLIRDLDTDSLNGMYFLCSEGVPVLLSGKLMKDHYSMRGLNARGKTIATFTGDWLDTVISGRYSLVSKKQNYSFQLKKEDPKIRIAVFGLDGKQIFGPVQFRKENYERKNPKYEMSITYPVVTEENQDTYWGEMFNARMKAFAKSRERNFPKQIPKQPVDGSSSNMTLYYGIKNDYRFLISVLFREETYVAGAPHPTATSYAFNFDVANNTWLELKDLFQKKTKYLERISKYCTEHLIEKLGDREEVRQGASPQESNFQSFCCTKEGLLIHFDQYQVSSYAEGEHEVLIPYHELKDILAPNCPVMAFMQ